MRVRSGDGVAGAMPPVLVPCLLLHIQGNCPAIGFLSVDYFVEQLVLSEDVYAKLFSFSSRRVLSALSRQIMQGETDPPSVQIFQHFFLLSL
jgi:hypothetical protein